MHRPAAFPGDLPGHGALLSPRHRNTHAHEALALQRPIILYTVRAKLTVRIVVRRRVNRRLRVAQEEELGSRRRKLLEIRLRLQTASLLRVQTGRA